MSCLESKCSNCQWSSFDNNLWKECPICKSTEVRSWFDESNESLSGDDYEQNEDE